MKPSYLATGLISSAVFVLSACANTSPLTATTSSPNQTISATPMDEAPVPAAVIKPAAMGVDWQKIEALADKKYEDEPLPDHILAQVDKSNPRSVAAFYAREVNVSIAEAHNRLILQVISAPLVESIKAYLNDAWVGVYYENNTDEFAIKITTLNTVEAMPPKYIYHFKQQEFEDYSLPIYIQANSDKTQEQILALQQQATPEILKRYPDTQAIGFSPMMNAINITIYRKIVDETERQGIETELTELVGHPVTVEFIENRITTL